MTRPPAPPEDGPAADAWYQQNLDRLPDDRAAHDAELARLINLLVGFTPAARKRLHILTVRCPVRGCDLGSVYEFALRDGGQRFIYRGRTASGKPKDGILNWPYADDWHGPAVFYSVGCRHGLAKIERAWLLDCIGAVQVWKHAMETEEQFLASLPPEMSKGRKNKVFHPKGEAWTLTGSAVLPSDRATE